MRKKLVAAWAFCAAVMASGSAAAAPLVLFDLQSFTLGSAPSYTFTQGGISLTVTALKADGSTGTVVQGGPLGTLFRAGGLGVDGGSSLLGSLFVDAGEGLVLSFNKAVKVKGLDIFDPLSFKANPNFSIFDPRPVILAPNEAQDTLTIRYGDAPGSPTLTHRFMDVDNLYATQVARNYLISAQDSFRLTSITVSEVSPVPEAQTGALALAGLAVALAVARRRTPR